MTFEELDNPGPSCINSGTSGNSEADRESLVREGSVESSEDVEQSSSGRENVRKRREYLDAKLTGYKREKMKRKLPVDTQLLACAREELAIKKRLVDQMDSFEKQYSDNMTKLSTNMEKLSNSITEGFSMLKHLIAPPHPSYMYMYQYPMYNNTFDASYSQLYDPPASHPSTSNEQKGWQTVVIHACQEYVFDLLIIYYCYN